MAMHWRGRSKHATLCPISSSDQNRIGGAMASVLASSSVDRVFEPCSGQIKEYRISICCFSAKNAALRNKSKD